PKTSFATMIEQGGARLTRSLYPKFISVTAIVLVVVILILIIAVILIAVILTAIILAAKHEPKVPAANRPVAQRESSLPLLREQLLQVGGVDHDEAGAVDADD